MKVIIGVIFLVFAILIGMQKLEQERVLFYASLNSDHLNIDDIENNNEEGNENTIHIILSGNIKKPGEYIVESGTFLEEILNNAGGCLDDTDYQAFNPYLLVEIDSSFYIPSVNSFNKISLNSATIDEFQTIPSIGITLATRIVDYRTKNGSFQQLEDVMQVNGIKEMIFDKIKDYLIL